jgi:hypothetical protein
MVGSTVGGQPGGEAIPATFAGDLNGEEGEIPVSLYIGDVWGYALSLEVLCSRTPEAFAKWQLETYSAIMRAYFELKSQYDEQVAAAGTRAGVAIEGRNPLQNRTIERTELKRAAVSMLTRAHFEDFDAIDEDPADGLPEIDFGEAASEGSVIQFFEQSLERAQMTYVFYPYFWGRREKWIDVLGLEDPDPVFSGFLRAGAARVAVPVRPGFDDVVLHYLGTGQIWDGGQVPQVDDELYVSVAQQLEEQSHAEQGGKPVGDPWEVRLPTTLVMLQADATLPQAPA